MCVLHFLCVILICHPKGSHTHFLLEHVFSWLIAHRMSIHFSLLINCFTAVNRRKLHFHRQLNENRAMCNKQMLRQMFNKKNRHRFQHRYQHRLWSFNHHCLRHRHNLSLHRHQLLHHRLPMQICRQKQNWTTSVSSIRWTPNGHCGIICPKKMRIGKNVSIKFTRLKRLKIFGALLITLNHHPSWCPVWTTRSSKMVFGQCGKIHRMSKVTWTHEL